MLNHEMQTRDIVSMIFYIRGKKVMLDNDLASIYNVETKVLNQAVKRNQKRFPGDFIFQLTQEEWVSLRSQIVTLKNLPGKQKGHNRRGIHRKFLPYVFTEHGALMLASVLNSEEAINASIFVVRAFIKLREFIEINRDLAKKIEELERTLGVHDENIQLIFETIRQLIEKKNEPREPVGFKNGKR